jgi:hypothetical protein
LRVGGGPRTPSLGVNRSVSRLGATILTSQAEGSCHVCDGGYPRRVDDIWVRVGFLIVGLLLGAPVGLGFGEFVRRPKLKANGSSGGGGPQYGYSNAMHFTNAPAFLGVAGAQTIIFGRRVHGPFAVGLPISRHAATDCRAFLHDRETDEFVASLWWRVHRSGTIEYEDTVTLGTGESGELMLFARQDQDATEYFPFVPAPSANRPPNFETPAQSLRFTESRTFTVKIMYGYGGRQVRKFPISVKRRLRGGLEFRTPSGRST